MIKKLKNNRMLAMRILVCVMTVFSVAGMFVIQGFADKDAHKDDFSFYRVASAAATYYDQTHNDKADNKENLDKFAKDGATLSDLANIGVAGNLVGFVDEGYSKGFFGATISKLSSSSQARSYMSFRNDEKALLAYVQYGHSLQMLGFDSTANMSLDISSIMRFLVGALLILAYSLAVMVSLLFKAVLTLLQGLNPFAWFLGSDAVKVPFHSWFANASSHMPLALKGIQDIVSTLYSSMSAIGILLIPIFFVILVASIILFRSGKSAMGDGVLTKIRKYVTRVVFILAGIPILGASYTACLDALLSGNDSDAFSISTSAANDVVGSTLVDFEAWSVNKRLALPSGVSIKLSGAKSIGGTIDTGTTDLRSMARNINAMSNPYLTRPTSTTAAMDGAAIDISKPSASTSEPSVFAAYDVMLRYMLSDYYTAADLETQYKASMVNKKEPTADEFWDWIMTGEGDIQGPLMDYIESDAKVKNYMGKNKLAGKDAAGPYMNDNKPGGISVSQSGDTFTYTGNGSKGLSTLSMYNYLTSSFSSSSVTTHSNNKVAALIMSHAHRSVSAIGGGMTRALYVLYAIVMLLVIAIIGFCYAMGVLFGMFRRGVSMIMSTPFALMGNFRAMSKVTTIVAMMIIELIGTVFIYQVVIYFLTNIMDIVISPVYAFLNGNKGGTIVPIMNAIGIPAISNSSFGGQVLQIAALMLAIIMLIVFAFHAVKLRKSFVKTMDEMAAGVIDRIFSPTGGEAGGAGAAYAGRPTLGDKVANGAKQVAGAAGTGLAMAGANKRMQGKPSRDGTSKGDAALAGGMTKDSTAEGDELNLGNKGIEGGDQQGLPGPDGPNNPGGPPALTGAGGSPEEKAGQKLLSGQSLGDNSTKGIGTNGGASAGKGRAVDAKTAKLATVESGQTLSEAGKQRTDAMAKATGRKNAAKKTHDGAAKTAVGGAKTYAGAQTGNAKTAVRGAQQTHGGAAKTAVGGAKTYAGAQTGNAKTAVRGAQQTHGGAQKAKGGTSQGANAKRLATQQTVDGKVAPKSAQDVKRAMKVDAANAFQPRRAVRKSLTSKKSDDYL